MIDSRIIRWISLDSGIRPTGEKTVLVCDKQSHFDLLVVDSCFDRIASHYDFWAYVELPKKSKYV